MGIPKILFLCTGNICRSPMAEGIFLNLAQKKGKSYQVISAGFSQKLENLPYHPLATEVCGQNNIELYGNSKIATRELISSADYIFALDFGNLNSLYNLDQGEEFFSKIYYLRTFASFPVKDLNIPDPMGKAKADFENSFKIIQDCCVNLLDQLEGAIPRSDALTLAEQRKEETTEDYLYRQNIYNLAQEAVNKKECLVIGCEDGTGVNVLAKNAHKVVGIDTQLLQLNFSAKNIDFRQLRYGAINTIEIQFDYIFCLHILDYIFTHRTPHFLDSIKSLLKENGVAIFLIKRNITADQLRELLNAFFPFVHVYEDSLPVRFFKKLTLGFYSAKKSSSLAALVSLDRNEFEQNLQKLPLQLQK
jgi:protein-tyrosine phosphatase